MNIRTTDLTEQEKIQAMMLMAEMTYDSHSVSTTLPFKNRQKPLTLKGDSFCPGRLKSLVNTFPPVWEFKASHFVIDYHPLTSDYHLLLSGRIIQGGKLSYYLGRLTFDNDTVYRSNMFESHFSPFPK